APTSRSTRCFRPRRAARGPGILRRIFCPRSSIAGATFPTIVRKWICSKRRRQNPRRRAGIHRALLRLPLLRRPRRASLGLARVGLGLHVGELVLPGASQAANVFQLIGGGEKARVTALELLVQVDGFDALVALGEREELLL